jgi:flagellar secretion chaperone FliS
MSHTPQDAYLESKVLTASPLELVRLLYRAAAEDLCQARRHLAEGHIRERSAHISHALDCLYELSGSLDHTQGGTLSRSLAELYDYMQRRLLQANLRQTPDPLLEVEGLLNTLLEGWEAYAAGDHSGTRPAWESSPHPATLQLAADQAYSTQSWSF